MRVVVYQFSLSLSASVNFMNGQLASSGSQKFPKFTLYQKANDRSQKRRIMVEHCGTCPVFQLGSHPCTHKG